MLEDPREIAIISKAQQENVRNPQRSRLPFERIFGEFLRGVPFQGRVFLDLGPGQFDFGVMARARGAEVHALDRDPAVLELGAFKGFRVLAGDMTDLKASDLPCRYDGVFCKYSINAFWFDDEQRHHAFLRELRELLKPDAWGWLAPWNGATGQRSAPEIERALDLQRAGFHEAGFAAFELSDRLAKHYGVHGSTANRALFTRNLPRPWRLRLFAREATPPGSG